MLKNKNKYYFKDKYENNILYINLTKYNKIQMNTSNQSDINHIKQDKSDTQSAADIIIQPEKIENIDLINKSSFICIIDNIR